MNLLFLGPLAEPTGLFKILAEQERFRPFGNVVLGVVRSSDVLCIPAVRFARSQGWANFRVENGGWSWPYRVSPEGRPN
jgi:hypothetical protein